MDPLTAWAVATTAVAEMITEIIKGQSPEVKAQIWMWWVEDMKRWRKFFKLDENPT